MDSMPYMHVNMLTEINRALNKHLDDTRRDHNKRYYGACKNSKTKKIFIKENITSGSKLSRCVLGIQLNKKLYFQRLDGSRSVSNTLTKGGSALRPSDTPVNAPEAFPIF